MIQREKRKLRSSVLFVTKVLKKHEPRSGGLRSDRSYGALDAICTDGYKQEPPTELTLHSWFSNYKQKTPMEFLSFPIISLPARLLHPAESVYLQKLFLRYFGARFRLVAGFYQCFLPVYRLPKNIVLFQK